MNDPASSSERSLTGYIVAPDDRILVTGANGFVGSRVVGTLLSYGFKNVRCVVRPTSSSRGLESMAAEFSGTNLEIVRGNLLSRDTCLEAVEGVSVIYHLAAGTDKTYAGCVLNSAVTTRNLLDAASVQQTLKRFVNTSSFSVYSNGTIKRGGLLDESCPFDKHLVERYDAYAYGKVKQDEVVLEYGQKKGLPYVIVRPGLVFGPGKARIPGRVGLDTFGVFLHTGLGNSMPFTYVENCAEAIVLAGLKKGIEGEVINIVDDDLPTSRRFLRQYKKQVRRFISIPIPYPIFYFLNYMWEKYAKWSEGQLPPVFNRKSCQVYFKGNKYANAKAKEVLGWRPRVSMSEGLERFFAYAREEREQR